MRSCSPRLNLLRLGAHEAGMQTLPYRRTGQVHANIFPFRDLDRDRVCGQTARISADCGRDARTVYYKQFTNGARNFHRRADCENVCLNSLNVFRIGKIVGKSSDQLIDLRTTGDRRRRIGITAAAVAVRGLR